MPSRVSSTPTPPRAEFVNNVFFPAGDRYRVFGQEARDLSLLAFDTTSRTIVRSVDDAQTWQPYASFVFPAGDSIKHIHHLPNGEVVVASEFSNGATGPRVYRSSGWATPATATFLHTFSLTKDTWLAFGSFFGDRDVIIISEYGKQTRVAAAEGTNPAACAYVSRDGGITFTKVFDLRTNLIDDETTPWGTTTRDQHLHGCGYDALWDRLWVVIGDAVPATGSWHAIIYSDDGGTTWKSAHKHFYAHWQSVGVMPLRNAVTFGSDNEGNGVRRVGRKGHREATQISAAHVFDHGTGIRSITTWLYRAPGLPNAPAIYGFASVFAKYPGGVVISLDEGASFSTVWTDPNTQASDLNFKGVQRVVGPSNTGRYVTFSDDTTRFPTGSIMVSELVVPEQNTPSGMIQLGMESFSAALGTGSGPIGPAKGALLHYFSRWSFTNEGDQSILGSVTIPSDWTRVRVELLFSTSSSDPGAVKWRLLPGYGFEKDLIAPFPEVTATVSGSNLDLMTATFPVFETRGQAMRIRVDRIATDAADTYPNTANLHAVRIRPE